MREEQYSVRSMEILLRWRSKTQNCYRDELVFYSERLMRILMEEALNFLPYEDIEVEVQPGTT